MSENAKRNEAQFEQEESFFFFFYNQYYFDPFYCMANISIVLDNNTCLFIFKLFIHILRKYKINEIFTDSELYIIL